jgi:2-haloalkanoic acid dehalogenase type II
MNALQAICLDLDDTLWDLKHVIPRAERSLYAWFKQHYPAVADNFTQADVRELRQQVAEQNPQLRHDLTALRMKALAKIAADSGYPESMAAEAFQVFDVVRNQVDLYPDVMPALDRLGKHYRLLTLSNGNANLQRIGLAHYFAQSYSARELGVAKPEPEVFHAVCAAEKLPAEQILHVGDHPGNDIIAARHAGMQVAWVNRQGAEWPANDVPPDYMVACLEELATALGV